MFGARHSEMRIFTTSTWRSLEALPFYDLTSPVECTAWYATELSLDASSYDLLNLGINGDNSQELASAVIGLSDEMGSQGELLGLLVGHARSDRLDDIMLERAGLGGNRSGQQGSRRLSNR